MTLFDRIKQVITPNKLYRQIYQWIGTNTPISIEQNADEYVREAYSKNALVYSVVSQIASTAADSIKHVKFVNAQGEEVEDDKLRQLFSRPNPLQGRLNSCRSLSSST